MVLTFFILYMVAATVYFNNREKSWGIWISLLLFSFGSGAFGKSLVENFFPFLVEHEFIDPSYEYLFQFSYSIGSFLNQNVSPYCFIMFALTYSGLFSKKTIRILSLLLLIPLFFMVLNTTFYPKVSHNYILVGIWAIPCFIIGTIYMLYSTIKDKNFYTRKDKKLLNYLLIPPFLANVFTNYIGHIVGLTSMWRLNAIPVSLAAIALVIMSTKMGILGIRLKLEKQTFDSTVKAVTSGTALLNHTIKNELAKIDLLTNQLKETFPGNEPENINLILKSTNHVLELSSRIQSKLDIMEIKESEFWLSDLIKSSIDLIQPNISGISIIKNYEIDAKVYGDFVHLQETALNIMKNAIEAMDQSGVLQVKIYQTRKKTHIDFIDNGKGIEKDKVSQIFDPFFSTKKRVGNFGLGLTYCYNVLTKHEGAITVKSELGQGTTISLSIPNTRVNDKQFIQESKEELAGDISYG